MLLKYFYDKKLAHASYMVGCQRAGEAIVVDPGRDIEEYLEAAEAEGMTLVGAVETHIHADFVSGARELAERVGLKLYLSDEGPEDWKYLYYDDYEHQLLRDKDQFKVGKILFEVLHTPGHTPESISLVLTDQGGGADRPMGVFTGDFVFVGAIGRPDLLQEAAGVADTAEPGARDLFHSLERFKELPEYLQVWPAHGAGSACGKGLGAIPSSTVGYEKRFNPAFQYTDEQAFVDYILADQPEAPKYFALMKRVNKEGPKLLGADHQHALLPLEKLSDAKANGNLVDLRSSTEFAEGHLSGAINIPLSSLATWAGWLLDYSRPTYLLCTPGELEEAARVLHKIGVENIAGAFSIEQIKLSGMALESYPSATPQELASAIDEGEAYLVDVRSQAEWDEGHIERAHHHFLGRLPETISEIPRSQPVVVQCRSGARSAVAASLLQAAGFKDVVNLKGGYTAWKSQGYRSVKPQVEHAG